MSAGEGEVSDEQVEAVEHAIRGILLGDLDDDGPSRVAVAAVRALTPWLDEPTMAFYACGYPRAWHRAADLAPTRDGGLTPCPECESDAPTECTGCGHLRDDLPVTRDGGRDEALRERIEALAESLATEADAICPEGEYDKQDKAWRVAHVRRRVAGDLRAALAATHPEADQ